MYNIIHLISPKTEGKRNTKHIFCLQNVRNFHSSFLFCLFLLGYSWEKLTCQTLSFYHYLWLHNPLQKKAVKGMTALRKVTIIERLYSYLCLCHSEYSNSKMLSLLNGLILSCPLTRLCLF